ncbi:MAG TPA: toll/interleukin-1 receptor domain-containing protein [Puia sp.]|nr:toll/interleukin-1 receptor domain-containing protein [Puia sp.]
MIPPEWQAFLPSPGPLQPGKKWHVFLSYRSVNRGWVLNLYDVLTQLGFKVFLDQYVLLGGDSLIQVLQNGLTSSQAGVLIWSNAAKDSVWVANEYETLLNLSINNPPFRFVPIKIERAPLPAFANNKLFLDFTDYPDGPGGGELLRLVSALVGVPLGDKAVHFAWEQDEASGVAAAQISAAVRNGYSDRLVELFEKGGLPWRTTAILGCKAAEGLTALGCNDKAIAILQRLQTEFPGAIRPKQLVALALARRGGPGDLEMAQNILGELYASNHLDPETVGLYGRTWMDRYKLSQIPSDLRQSRNLYAEGFEKAPDDYYTGVNAASKSLLLGEPDKAAAYAKRVESIVGNTAVRGDYWWTATIAEVLLLQGKYAEAGDMYQQAIDMAPTQTASHGSTYKQARLLLSKFGATTAEQLLVLQPFKGLPDYITGS